MKKKRNKLDQYFTPTQAVQEMLSRLPFELEGHLYECCSGQGAISNELEKLKNVRMTTNDIDTFSPAQHNLDVTEIGDWRGFEGNTDWVITNPPFCNAPQIVENAYRCSKKGVIMLLRLSFLEPCKNRVDFLEKHPPSMILVTPRISFSGKSTDTVTTAWFVWIKNKELAQKIQSPIQVIRKK